MRSFRTMAVAVGSVVALACGGAEDRAEQALGSAAHRVRASGPAAQELRARGAVVLADYGAFQLLDAPAGAISGGDLAAGVELRDDDLRIHLNSGDLDTRSSLAAALAGAAAGEPGARALRLVQFVGPIRPEWRARLEESGLRVVAYVPANAYLVYGPAEGVTALRQRLAAPTLQYLAPLAPALKVDAALAGRAPGAYSVQLVEDPAVNGETLALARSLARVEPRVQRALGYVDVVLQAGPEAVEALAARPDVVSVLERAEPRLNDERQDMVLAGALSDGIPTGPGYLDWLAAKGFTQAQFDASGFGVDVSDSGVDNGTDQPEHFGLYRGGSAAAGSRVAYNRLEGTPHTGSTLQGCDGHGNINAHIIGGYASSTSAPFADGQGFRYGLGVAPFVRLGSSVVFDPGTFTEPSYEDLQSRAYAAGMRVSSNSWGAASAAYDWDCQRYDALVRDAQPNGSAVAAPGNQEMVIVFAAGNDGPGAGSIGSPANAKNVIAVGATEGVQPFGAADRCSTTDSSADSAMDVADFSSHGPSSDGRVRPDLMAPGTHISGGVAQAPGQLGPPPAVALGSAIACFSGAGVCGGPGIKFFPAGQQWYTASSGTSHSCPAVAGAAALLRQWFLNQALAAPSPAMTKAYLASSTRHMTGAGAGDSLFSNSQGMGLLDLGAAFDGTPRLLRDQDPADLLTASGQVRTFSGSIGDTTRPFRVTLAWTDAPGSTVGAAYVNDLDLTVEVGGQVYRGNVFSGATSVTGGSADLRNNLESVFLPAGTSGPYTVTVAAANVAADGVPGNSSTLDQDFALVVVNSCGSPVPAAPTGLTVTPAGENVLSVSWTPVDGATYEVVRSRSADGPWERAGTVDAPAFLDAGRSGGITYHYQVRARSGCALSAPTAGSGTATGPCMQAPAFAGLARAATTGYLTCGNELSWSAATASCGGTVTYDVFRGAPGFTPGDANRIATGLSATSWVDAGGLSSGTEYAYVVRAVETVGGRGPVADGNTVARTARPLFVLLDFQDDFDANRPASPSGWWEERSSGGDALELVRGCRYQSAISAYRFGAPGTACGGTYGNYVVNRLVLGGDGTGAGNGFFLPAAGATLAFRLWYDLEASRDGAWLEYSTTGAHGTFQQVPTSATAGRPYIASGGYDGTAQGTPAWTGRQTSANGSLRQVTVNLDGLAGQTVWFAWAFRTDSRVVGEGVYLDDVAVTGLGGACSTAPVPVGSAVRFRIRDLPPELDPCTPVTVTIEAVNRSGAVATDYAGTATLSGDPGATLPASVTFAGGQATAQITLRPWGTFTLKVADASAPAVQGSASTQVRHSGPAAALRFPGMPPITPETAGVTFSPTVLVEDACGNQTSSGATVTLSLAAGPAGATLGGTTSVAASAGVATFAVSLDRAGTGYRLAASADGLTSDESEPFSVVAGPAARLVLTAQPTTAIAGHAFTPPLVVTALDAFGNTASTAVPVQLAIGSGPAGAHLMGTTSVAYTGRPASFGAASLDLAGSYTLVASSPPLESATTDTVVVTHGDPTVARIVQAPSTAQVGIPLDPPLVASVADAYGNVCDEAQGPALVASTTSPAILGDRRAAPVNGSATFPRLAFDRPGGQTVRVCGEGLGCDDANVDVVAGPVTRYLVSGPARAAVGEDVSLRATAATAAGEAEPRYLGRASVSTTDAVAEIPPGPLTITAGESGSFHVVFHTGGPQQITVRDAAGNGVEGTLTVEVVPTGGGGGGCGGCSSGGAGTGAMALLLLAAVPARRRRVNGRR